MAFKQPVLCRSAPLNSFLVMNPQVFPPSAASFIDDFPAVLLSVSGGRIVPILFQKSETSFSKRGVWFFLELALSDPQFIPSSGVDSRLDL